MSIINGVTVPDANDWTPTQEIVRAAEMVNGYGDTIGDYVGSRYKPSWKWTLMPSALLDALVAATDPLTYPTFQVTHPILGGADHTGTYRVTDPVQGAKITYDQDEGCVIWQDVTLSLIEVMHP